ncbi:MAG TPA: hemerythrin domain-containing protein [Pyrinomonadaceae bacterium]|nr:hemerythrin domain-containing protein [Pyrinomonadaceae bacterium]
MDAFKLLQADHRNVAALFEELEQASGKTKISVFNEIKTELELHAHIEEAVFYPALEGPRETADLTAEAYEEHAEVKKLLRELSRTKSPNEEWEAQVKVLQENVEHHVEEEENELFPKAEQVLSEEELEDLGERLQAEKSRGQRQASKKSSKKSGAKKSAGSKKSGGKSKASKKQGGTKKSAAKKSSKKSSKKTTKKSRSKKSAKKGRR